MKGFSTFDIIIKLAITLGICYYVFLRFKRRRGLDIIHSRWQHSFDDFQFSSKEFYQSVVDIVKSRKVDGLGIDYMDMEDRRVLLAKREYLRITRGEYIFLVCTAPFGTGYFVSWWLGERVGFFKYLLLKVPWLYKFWYKKTLFQMDTESMFQGCIRKGVQEAIEAITNAKGLRGLTELEREPIAMSM